MDKNNSVGARLKRLREAQGYTSQAAFAALLGISPPRWNNIEKGLPLSREIAFKLVQKVPGLTLDWLYFGKPDGMPIELARRLGELPSSTGKRTSKPR